MNRATECVKFLFITLKCQWYGVSILKKTKHLCHDIVGSFNCSLILCVILQEQPEFWAGKTAVVQVVQTWSLSPQRTLYISSALFLATS